MGDERVVSREAPAVETNEKRIEDVEAENRRRMRLSRRLATMDNIVAELEDLFTPECDSDDDIE